MTIKHKRRDIFSYPREQIKLVAVFGLLAFLFITTNVYVSKSTITAVSKEMMEQNLTAAQRHDLQIVVGQRNAALDVQMAMLTFLSVFVLVMSGVYISHKTMGPMTQLRNYLRGMSKGETRPRRIAFRRGDMFTEVAEAFNLFQESLGVFDKVPPSDGDADKKPETPEKPAAG